MYLSGQYTIKEEPSETSITHSLSFIPIRNIVKHKQASIDCFVTHFSSHKAFKRFLELLYHTFVESYIYQKHFLKDKIVF